MKIIFVASFALLFTTCLYGQPRNQKSDQIDRIKAQKVAFITEKLGLTSAVAQRFWPVYNEYWAERDSLINKRSRSRKDLKERMQELTAAQKEAALDLQLRVRLEEAKLDRHYHNKFMDILTIDQVILLYEAQHEFRIRLIKQLRESRDHSMLKKDHYWVLSLKNHTF